MNLRPLLVVALFTTPLAGCTTAGYGSDNSHVGDLLQGDALQLEGDYGLALPSFDIMLLNSTQPGACLGLADSTATLNGVPATVRPGWVEDNEGFTQTVCPDLLWDDISKLGDTLNLVIVDVTRPAGNPYRTFSITFANPAAPIAWPGAAVHAIHSGDHLELSAPGEILDEASWDAYGVETCTGGQCYGQKFGEGNATVKGGQIEITPTVVAGGAGTLDVSADGHATVTGCEHATCDIAVWQTTTFAIDAE